MVPYGFFSANMQWAMGNGQQAIGCHKATVTHHRSGHPNNSNTQKKGRKFQYATYLPHVSMCTCSFNKINKFTFFSPWTKQQSHDCHLLFVCGHVCGHFALSTHHLEFFLAPQTFLAVAIGLLFPWNFFFTFSCSTSFVPFIVLHPITFFLAVAKFCVTFVQANNFQLQCIAHIDKGTNLPNPIANHHAPQANTKHYRLKLTITFLFS